MNRLASMNDKEFRFKVIQDLIDHQKQKKEEAADQKYYSRVKTHQMVINRLEDWQSEIMLDMDKKTLSGYINCLEHGEIEIAVDAPVNTSGKEKYSALCPICRTRYLVKFKDMEGI